MGSTATSKNKVYLEPKKGQLSKNWYILEILLGMSSKMLVSIVNGQELLNQISKHLFYTVPTAAGCVHCIAHRIDETGIFTYSTVKINQI